MGEYGGKWFIFKCLTAVCGYEGYSLGYFHLQSIIIYNILYIFVLPSVKLIKLILQYPFNYGYKWAIKLTRAGKTPRFNINK